MSDQVLADAEDRCPVCGGDHDRITRENAPDCYDRMPHRRRGESLVEFTSRWFGDRRDV